MNPRYFFASLSCFLLFRQKAFEFVHKLGKVHVRLMTCQFKIKTIVDICNVLKHTYNCQQAVCKLVLGENRIKLNPKCMWSTN